MPRRHLDLLQGTLDMLILQTLSNGPRHGYGIATFIGEASKGLFRILDGALYAALHRLERSGLVAAYWGVSDRGRRARFYQVTSAGRVAAREECRRWHQYANGVANVMVASPHSSTGNQEAKESDGGWRAVEPSGSTRD
jgi:transcriptional regulator